MIIYSPEQVLRRGLRIAGASSRLFHRQKRETSVEDFKSFFGSHPAVLAQIWEDLQTTSATLEDKNGNTVSAQIDTTKTRSVHLKNFLRAHQFLKQYQTEKQRKLPFRNMEKTLRKWCWYFVERMAALRQEKIVWPDDSEWTTAYIATVDGVHCLFHEVKHAVLAKDPNYFSHKKNGPGLSYELALHIWEPRLIWLKRNAKTKTNDLGNYKSELKGKVPASKKLVVDRGYHDSKDKQLAPPNSYDTEELQIFKAHARMRQEGFHAKIEAFGCLHQRFRHSVKWHEDCFTACCIICQYQMELVSPVYDV